MSIYNLTIYDLQFMEQFSYLTIYLSTKGLESINKALHI